MNGTRAGDSFKIRGAHDRLHYRDKELMEGKMRGECHPLDTTKLESPYWKESGFYTFLAKEKSLRQKTPSQNSETEKTKKRAQNFLRGSAGEQGGNQEALR